MPSGSSRIDPERRESSENPADDGTERSSPTSWYLRDPVLLALVGFRTVVRSIDLLHHRFERLPGWVRFGFGVTTFVASAYLGEWIRGLVEELLDAVFIPAVGTFLQLPLTSQGTILLLLLVSYQTTVVNQRTKSIESELKSREMTADDSPLPDGGRVYYRLPKVGSGRTGALGGIAPGMALGMLFGWGTMFGGAVLGAIVGDEIEKWYDRRRNRRKIASFVIRVLLQEEVQSPESIPVERVKSWFPTREAELVDDVLADLTSGEDAPLTMVGDGQVGLTDVDVAEAYLREELGMVTLPR